MKIEGRRRFSGALQGGRTRSLFDELDQGETIRKTRPHTSAKIKWECNQTAGPRGSIAKPLPEFHFVTRREKIFQARRLATPSWRGRRIEEWHRTPPGWNKYKESWLIRLLK